MTAKASRKAKPLAGPRPWRIVRARPRLFSCIAVGIMVSAALMILPSWRWVMRALVGWDIGVGQKRFVYGSDASNNGGPPRLIVTVNALGTRSR